MSSPKLACTLTDNVRTIISSLEPCQETFLTQAGRLLPAPFQETSSRFSLQAKIGVSAPPLTVITAEQYSDDVLPIN